ncbi:yippee-domain-containing protein [Hyphopichia burtonii NRRL Y-1933]|uniref:Yippee-domain-containing protein n=1 Tax=Hyphopichia burtonii NRRL Y-1933 TaxID=984485 RepID=A0A1E4RFZ1_9ASCO|nr:yippee-domain-containing protein [Hyphopichia burtonii NRRL Y-1933]ODV66055.1 yippee-domain-containing protein [Hyphopichia burtonii NRRL Y-1933]
MGLKDTEFFDNENYEATTTQIIICQQCSSHLCLSNLIISDGFTGSSGEALLVDKIINYQADPEIIESTMLTGDYLTRSVRCKQCLTRLGWTYKKAFRQREAYKEGKFVIEKKFLKSIPNNSATSDLIVEARRNSLDRRRRSSATISLSNSSIDEINHHNCQNDFKFNNLPLDPYLKSLLTTHTRNSFSFRDFYNATSNSRVRHGAMEKDDFEEEDEDNEVFVDV